jgi:hypothetical protein
MDAITTYLRYTHTLETPYHGPCMHASSSGCLWDRDRDVLDGRYVNATSHRIEWNLQARHGSSKVIFVTHFILSIFSASFPAKSFWLASIFDDDVFLPFRISSSDCADLKSENRVSSDLSSRSSFLSSLRFDHRRQSHLTVDC